MITLIFRDVRVPIQALQHLEALKQFCMNDRRKTGGRWWLLRPGTVKPLVAKRGVGGG